MTDIITYDRCNNGFDKNLYFNKLLLESFFFPVSFFIYRIPTPMTNYSERAIVRKTLDILIDPRVLTRRSHVEVQPAMHCSSEYSRMLTRLTFFRLILSRYQPDWSARFRIKWRDIAPSRFLIATDVTSPCCIDHRRKCQKSRRCKAKRRLEDRYHSSGFRFGSHDNDHYIRARWSTRNALFRIRGFESATYRCSDLRNR